MNRQTLMASWVVLTGMMMPVTANGQDDPAFAPRVIVATGDADTGIQVFNTLNLSAGGATFLPMMLGGDMQSPSNWLHDPQVQKELGIVQDQMKKIQELRAASTKRHTEMMKTLRDVAPEKRGEFLMEMQQVLRKDLEKDIQQVLLPHQSKRLEEVSLQMHMKRSGHNALRSKKLAEMLGLSEKQVKDLQKKQMEAQRRMAEQMAKLRKEAEEEMMSVLSPDQQKKLESLLGKKFKRTQASLPGLLNSVKGAPRRVVREKR